MTWARQVVHVMRKDAITTGWFLLIMVTTTAALTWLAIEGRSMMYGSWTPVVALVAMIGICLTVQSDPPCEPIAFWATKPLSATAVASAKIMEGALMIVLLRGTVLLITTLARAPAGSPPAPVSNIGTISLLVAGAAILAAVTPNLRIFLVAVILTVIAEWFLIAFTLFTILADEAVALGLGPRIGLPAIGAIPVLLYTYHTRSQVHGAAAAALLLVLAVPLLVKFG